MSGKRARDERPAHYIRRMPTGAVYNGKTYDRGQGITLAGARNDDRLVTYGYVSEWPKDTEPAICGACGEPFVSDRFRAEHYQKRHGHHVLTDPNANPRDVDEAVAAEESALNREVPFTVPSQLPETITAGAAALPDV